MIEPGANGPGVGNRALLDLAMILHRRAYRESSLLVDIFSAEYGRLRLVARAARQGRNPQSQLLQAFTPLRLSWSGRGELPNLTAVEAAGEAMALDGAALYCGFYINELLLHLLPPHDPYPRVFDLYLDALGKLGAGSRQEEILRFFEIALLEEIGYGLSLDQEARGQDIDPDKSYSYIPERGPVEVGESLADAVRGSTLLALHHKRLDTPDQWREAKRLMRRVLNHHLSGRALKSRDLFKPIGRKGNP